MSTDELEDSLKDVSLEELIEALETGEITFQEINENEALRRRVRQFVVKRDMDEHREIYDRLAKV